MLNNSFIVHTKGHELKTKINVIQGCKGLALMYLPFGNKIIPSFLTSYLRKPNLSKSICHPVHLNNCNTFVL